MTSDIRAEVSIDGELVYVAENPSLNESGFSMLRLDETDSRSIRRVGPHIHLFFPPLALLQGISREALCNSVEYTSRGPFLGFISAESPAARESNPQSRHVESIDFSGVYCNEILTLDFSCVAGAVQESREAAPPSLRFRIFTSIPLRAIPSFVKGRDGFFFQKHLECTSFDAYIEAIEDGPPSGFS